MTGLNFMRTEKGAVLRHALSEKEHSSYRRTSYSLRCANPFDVPIEVKGVAHFLMDWLARKLAPPGIARQGRVPFVSIHERKQTGGRAVSFQLTRLEHTLRGIAGTT